MGELGDWAYDQVLKEEAMDEFQEVVFDGVIHETDMATLFEIDGEEVWIPKSVYEEDDEEFVIYVKTWFAEKEGLV